MSSNQSNRDVEEHNDSDIGMPLSQWLQFLDYAYRGLRHARPTTPITSQLFSQTIKLNTYQGCEMAAYFTQRPMQQSQIDSSRSTI